MKSAILFALGLGLSGCYVYDDPDVIYVVPTTGLLVVDWTISGSHDPSLCSQNGASVINIALETSNGFFVGEFERLCEAFVTGIELQPGGYFGDALLLDSFGEPRTTAADFGYFQIYGYDELVIPIDFPSDSFY